MDPKIHVCKLCDRSLKDAQVQKLHEPVVWRVSCERCGVYVMSHLAFRSAPPPEVKALRYVLSALARIRTETGADPLVIENEIWGSPERLEAHVAGLVPWTVPAKVLATLELLGERSSVPGQEIMLDGETDYPLVYCREGDELVYYLEYLRVAHLIELRTELGSTKTWSTISVKGWEKLDRESGIDGTKREQGFVAMWFDESLREVFEKSIEPLSAETGFRMLRMDRKQFNDKICDQILKEIRRSRFVIADVTGHRQGVYFEAGFALGLGIPVIWTCRQSDLKDAHFDTRQYNHIVWKDGADLQAQLGDRIAATIGFARR
jgi:hypothetical protein